MPGKFPKRVVIYSQDVMNITGLTIRSSNRLLKKIRKGLGKQTSQFITIKEFCLATGIKEELVIDHLSG